MTHEIQSPKPPVDEPEKASAAPNRHGEDASSAISQIGASDATAQETADAPSDPSFDKVNIYEINAYQALIRFERFVEGSVNDLLLVISSAGLPQHSRQAIESTAERLGLGGSRISWATILGREAADEPVPISAQNLHLLVESIDPAAIIVTDIGAMSILSEAYGTGLEADSSNRVACRTCATFSDFDTMLSDPDTKQKAWRVLKNLSLEL